MELSDQNNDPPANGTGPTNPHQIGRQLFGLVFWILLLTFGSGDPLTIGLALVLGGLTFADAWVSGIYKDPDKKSFLNISPMAWGIAMIGLHILAYPFYVLKRNSLRTIEGTNAIYVAVIVLGGFTFLGAVAYIALLFIDPAALQ